MNTIDESTATQQYDDMLDELYPDLTIAGLNYSTSQALKEIDPTAYRVGLMDYLDSEDLELE